MAKKKSSKSFDVAATEPAAQAVGARRRFGATDAAVLIAMAAVTAAGGFALHLQAGLNVPLAAELAAGLFLILTFIHMQRLRIESLRSAGQSTAGPLREPRAEPELQMPPYDDEAMDLATSKLAAAAAALRENDLVAHGQPPHPEAQSETENDPSPSWGEADAVDALVRQYARDLERGPQPAWPAVAAPAPAVASAAVGHSANARGEPSLDVPAPAESPLTTAIRKAADGEVEIHLQPVVSFADRKARMYEVFPRLLGSGGEMFGLAEYLPKAEAMGLSLRVERSALLRCCSIQRKLAERGKAKAMIFRLSGAAIRDRAFLQRLLADIRPDPLLANLIILEVDQLDIEQGGGAERDNMDLLANAGFRFSLGRAETLALEVAELAARRIGFVRLTPAVLNAEHNPKAVSDLRNGGIETILIGIEQDEDVRVGRAFGLVLGQGRLFSEPKPLRPDVAATGQGPAATPTPRPSKTRAA
jgi:cyclic-di-GMP phosphodiesterase, flagellum assembly factor TipF